VGHVNIIGTQAAIAAYKHGEPWRQELIKYLQSNLKFIEQRIKNIPGISMRPVEATYLAWLNVSSLKLDKPQKYFEEYGVGMSAGSEFGDNDYVRLNFGCQQEILIKALDRIEQAAHERMLILKKNEGPPNPWKNVTHVESAALNTAMAA